MNHSTDVVSERFRSLGYAKRGTHLAKLVWCIECHGCSSIYPLPGGPKSIPDGWSVLHLTYANRPARDVYSSARCLERSTQKATDDGASVGLTIDLHSVPSVTHDTHEGEAT